MGELELDQLSRLLYLLIGLILLTIIALIAYLVRLGRRVKEQVVARRQEQEEEVVIRPALQIAGEILSLVRDAPGGPLQVEVAGSRYRSLAEVSDPQVKRQVLDATLELIQFTGVLGAEVSPLVPLEKTHRWREDMRQSSRADLERLRSAQAAPSPAPVEVEEKFLSLLAEMGQAPAPPEKPSLIGSIQRRLQPKPVEGEQVSSFIEEIEQIVQRRVQLIPALAGRGLHVRSTAGGKVIFQFEGQQYDSLDDIPNLTARQLVKDAIQEWDETT